MIFFLVRRQEDGSLTCVPSERIPLERPLASDDTTKREFPWLIQIDASTTFQGSNFSVSNQAAFLWPGGTTLCQYLCSPATKEDAISLLGYSDFDRLSTNTMGSLALEGRSVLELGAGVGLASILIAREFPPHPSFVTTELSESSLVRLKRNLETNQVHSIAQACALDWRDLYTDKGPSLGLKRPSLADVDQAGTEDPFSAAFDVVVGADLMWDEDTAEWAIHAARRLTRRSFLLVLVHRSDFMKSYVEETLSKHGFRFQCRSWPVPAGSQACFVYLCRIGDE